MENFGSRQTTLDLNGPTFTWLTEPTSLEFCSAGVGTFIGIATATFPIQIPVNPSANDGYITYQWYVDGYGALTDGTIVSLGLTGITGSASTTLTVYGSSPTSHNKKFYIRPDYVPSAYAQPIGTTVTAGTARSTPNATNENFDSDLCNLTIYPTIAITSQPVGVTLPILFDTANFHIIDTISDTTQGDLTYQWTSNGVDLVDGTGSPNIVSGAQTRNLSLISDTIGIQNIQCRILHPTSCDAPLYSDVVEYGAISPDPVIKYEIIAEESAQLRTTGEQNLDSGKLDISYGDYTSVVDGRWKVAGGIGPNFTQLSDVIYAGGQFVAVSKEGQYRFAYSTDGRSWTTTSANSVNNGYYSSVTYGNGKYVACSTSLVAFAYSIDGRSWTIPTQTANNTSIWNGITYGSGKFVAVSGSGDAAYSTDGIQFETSQIDVDLNSITYGAGKFVAVGYNGKAAYSTDGINWNLATTPGTDLSWYSVTYGNGKFVAVNFDPSNSTTNRVMYSTDGISWTGVSAPANRWRDVHFADNKFVAVGKRLHSDPGMYSTDGINWTSVDISPGDDMWRAVTYGNGNWLAAEYYGQTITSKDATGVRTYTNQQTPVDPRNDIIVVYSPFQDADVNIKIAGAHGALNGNAGGPGGVSSFDFTLERGIEYVFALGAAGVFESPGGGYGAGGGTFFYRGSQLIACVGGGGGGAGGGAGGHGGSISHGGSNGAGSRPGSGASAPADGSLPIRGHFPGGSQTAYTPYGKTEEAVNGGRVSACTWGSWYVNRGYSPCTDIGTSYFRGNDGTENTNTAKIMRSYKAGPKGGSGDGGNTGWIYRQNGGNGGWGASVGYNGDGGGGAVGGQGGHRSHSGGGGGSGYSNGEPQNVLSHSTNSGNSYFEIALRT